MVGECLGMITGGMPDSSRDRHSLSRRNCDDEEIVAFFCRSFPEVLAEDLNFWKGPPRKWRGSNCPRSKMALRKVLQMFVRSKTKTKH